MVAPRSVLQKTVCDRKCSEAAFRIVFNLIKVGRLSKTCEYKESQIDICSRDALKERVVIVICSHENADSLDYGGMISLRTRFWILKYAVVNDDSGLKLWK